MDDDPADRVRGVQECELSHGKGYGRLVIRGRRPAGGDPPDTTGGPAGDTTAPGQAAAPATPNGPATAVEPDPKYNDDALKRMIETNGGTPAPAPAQ